MSLQHFFIRGKSFGTCERTPRWVHARVGKPQGHAFFCTICSELWANCPIEGEVSTVWHKHCDKHKIGDTYGSWSSGSVYSLDHPGSIMLSFDRDWNACLPLPVLVREFHLHFNLHTLQKGLSL